MGVAQGKEKESIHPISGEGQGVDLAQVAKEESIALIVTTMAGTITLDEVEENRGHRHLLEGGNRVIWKVRSPRQATILFRLQLTNASR